MFLSRCILSHSYIKPQLLFVVDVKLASCILSHSYIKPQLFQRVSKLFEVVSYLIPTSNHNS